MNPYIKAAKAVFYGTGNRSSCCCWAMHDQGIADAQFYFLFDPQGLDYDGEGWQWNLVSLKRPDPDVKAREERALALCFMAAISDSSSSNDASDKS